MSNDSSEGNPFSGLFAPNSTGSSEQLPKSSTNNSSLNILDTKINSLIERVFLFTINKNAKRTQQLVFMEDIAAQSETGLLDLDLLEHALFDRLLLTTPRDYLVPSDSVVDETSIVVETKVILYLFRAFEACERSRNLNDSILVETCDRIRSLILRNVCTAIRQPDLFEGQSIPAQWLEILKDLDNDPETKRDFLVQTAKDMQSDDEMAALGSLKAVFYPMLSEIQKNMRNANIITLEKWIIPLLTLFVSDKTMSALGEILVDFTTPNPDTEGIKFAETILGQLLSLSILPRNQNGPYEFYDNPMDSLSSNMNESLWNYLTNHLNRMHTIFKSLLLLGGSVKQKTLTWIGNCLHANIPRGQIWNTHNLSPLGSLTSASDAFMIGLCGVLLRLCQPLFKPGFKVLLVDPTYCAVPEGERAIKGVHLRKVSEETCLLPTEENETRITAETYNFITECFFMTHKAIDLSYRVCIEKFIRMSREIHRLQTAYQDTMAQGGSDVAQNIMQMLSSQMQQFMCLKNCIIEPNNDQFLLQFYEATAVWLTEVTGKSEAEVQAMIGARNFAPKERKSISLPLSPYVPPYVRSIPEYVLENIVGYLTFIRHFEAQTIELDNGAQEAIFKMILIFMGSVERARNPHLRARLAEGMESLLPKDVTNSFRASFKTKLFQHHPDRLQIVQNLLHVFVSIEMTGQSVQFEQKFNYRRPMYTIMEFLWGLDEQKKCFKVLALEAERNIEAVNPPIFLRFVNLLINDAIFLLDESLSNLQQIRTLQAAQDNGEWNNLPTTERQQNMANLQHLGMMARFDNILGRDTINILKLITSEIKEIFCHQSMVDRIASMLNYFLLHLVGPKKGSFKVKDKKEYEFDPANTVLEICRIYVHLKASDAFCLAVSQDGRSYSSELFGYAEQVLVRIGGGQLIGEMQEFAAKVQRVEKQHKEDQEALVDAPEEYLDPIMSTLMMDPVILPSSRVTIDRSTIARHLLSDQSDPFNRSSLTMDQVKTNVELKDEILRWIAQRRKEYSEKQQSQSTEN